MILFMNNLTDHFVEFVDSETVGSDDAVVDAWYQIQSQFSIQNKFNVSIKK